MARTKTVATRGTKSKIFIVDDHPMMRQGLAQLINNEPDLLVCCEADTAGQALNILSAHHVGGYLDPVYFTATGMIGMIALSGIVTRDSIILVDFIHLSLARGRSLFDAIMESRVVRLRPILLTAMAAMLGAVPIIIDPIFSGLAWTLIFGLFASTLFTLFVIPVAYWLLYANTPGHGADVSAMDQEE